MEDNTRQLDEDVPRDATPGPWEVSAYTQTCPAGLDGRRFRNVRSMARRRQNRSKDSWRQMWRNARLAQGVTLRYFTSKYTKLAAQAQDALRSREAAPGGGS